MDAKIGSIEIKQESILHGDHHIITTGALASGLSDLKAGMVLKEVVAGGGEYTPVTGAAAAVEAEILEGLAEGGMPFRKTVTLTSALATTPVEIIADDSVGEGKKVFITDFLVNVDGAVAWSGDGGNVLIRDTEDTPVAGVTIAKAGLTNAALVGKHTASNVTLGNAVKQGEGFTEAKGIEVVADGAFSAGSDLIITVVGFIGEDSANAPLPVEISATERACAVLLEDIEDSDAVDAAEMARHGAVRRDKLLMGDGETAATAAIIAALAENGIYAV